MRDYQITTLVQWVIWGGVVAAFQRYAGAYGLGGQSVQWSCYATSRIYEVRRRDHAPLPAAPAGRKWVDSPGDGRRGMAAAWLVDQSTSDFSQILLQISCANDARTPEPA